MNKKSLSMAPSRRQFLQTASGLLVPALFAQSGFANQAERTAEQIAVDQSIVKGLDFLASQQHPNGSWSIDNIGESTAATSLSIMSFLAAGYLPEEGPYEQLIRSGIKWVIDHQEDRGMLVHRRSHGPMYSHGISTLMLSEVTGTLSEPLASETMRALESAIRLILEAQQVSKKESDRGGWRYQPSSRDSDLSVTGWQLLALRAAKDIGCDVPADAIDQAIRYVERCAHPRKGGFCYQPGNDPTATRTGTGILCLEVCGDHRSDAVMRGVDYLMENPLKYDDSYFFYGVYYCGVGMFKVGGEFAEKTRQQIVPLLLEKQQVDGSWKSAHPSESRQGRVYSTAMALLCLAVEYQLLPIYQR